MVFAYVFRFFLWINEPTLSRDGTYYLLEAKGERVADYPMPHGKQAPLFPAILSMMNRYGVNPQKWGILLNILCSTALCWIIWLSCRQLKFKYSWSFFCAFLVAIHPEFVRVSHELQRESLYLFFSGCTILMAIIYMKSIRISSTLSSVFILGCVGAAAAATRHEGWELLPISLALFPFKTIYKRQYRIKGILICFGFMLLTIAGWMMSLIILLKLCDYPISLYFDITFGHLHRIRIG